MKYTVKNLKFAACLLGLVSMACITGCHKDTSVSVYHPYDDTYEGEYVVFSSNNGTAEALEVDTNGMIGETFANSITYEMYTNVGDWEIKFDYSRCFNPNPYPEWIEAWPNRGSGDGRFTIKFRANTDQGDTKYANINIVSDGRIVKTISVKQDGATAVRLNLAASFMSVLSMAADDTADKIVPLSVNVFWDAYVEYDDASNEGWLHLKDITNLQALEFSLDRNNSTETRSATIVIYQITDTNNTLTILVNQRGVGDE